MDTGDLVPGNGGPMREEMPMMAEQPEMPMMAEQPEMEAAGMPMGAPQ
jgi:hypothetical protein